MNYTYNNGVIFGQDPTTQADLNDGSLLYNEEYKRKLAEERAKKIAEEEAKNRPPLQAKPTKPAKPTEEETAKDLAYMKQANKASSIREQQIAKTQP